jgi:ubiquinone/menaquinone biosynthesis C-methylase UbiE
MRSPVRSSDIHRSSLGDADKAAIAKRFGQASHAYLKSSTHASGTDLDVLIDLLAPTPSMSVLDVATGAGHTAVRIAPRVRSVIAVDIAPEMIERTRELAIERGVANVTARVMDVESLEFADDSFDAVTCRIAPHHFVDIAGSVAEIHRVLRPGGRFVVEDSTVPDDPLLDAFLNDVERLRDPTHLRSFNESEWRAVLETAGFAVAAVTHVRKLHVIEDWLRTAGRSPGDSEPVYAAFTAASAEAVAHFEIVTVDGVPVSYTDEKILLRAERGP